MFLKNQRHENTVIALTFWLYLFVRIFGFWPFTIKFNANNRGSAVRIKSFDWFWFVVTTCYYFMSISTIILIGTLTKFQRLNSSLIEIVISNVTIVSDITIALVCSIMDMINRKQLWRTILAYHDFDQEVMKFLDVLKAGTAYAVSLSLIGFLDEAIWIQI